MKKKRFSPEQIIGVLKQAQVGVCRREVFLLNSPIRLLVDVIAVFHNGLYTVNQNGVGPEGIVGGKDGFDVTPFPVDFDVFVECYFTIHRHVSPLFHYCEIGKESGGLFKKARKNARKRFLFSSKTRVFSGFSSEFGAEEGT